MYTVNIFLVLAGITSATSVSGALQPVGLVAKRAFKPPSRRDIDSAVSKVPLADYYSNTDLQWYGNITVGTPPQTLSVVFDTSSNLFAIPSIACGSSCASKHKFNPTKSSTFKSDGSTSSVTRTTTLDTLPMTFNSYTLQLSGGTDTVVVAGIYAPQSTIWQITSETSNFASVPFDGFLGLPYDGSGFLSQLSNYGLPSLFTFYLTPHTVGNAALTLGSVDKKKYSGNLHYASLSNTPGWTLTATAIYVNGQTTSDLNKNYEITFDSSVSNVLAPLSVTQAIYGLISPDIQGIDFGMFGVFCDEISGLSAQIDITFVDQSGIPFNLTIPSSELNVGPVNGEPWICQTLINVYTDGPLIVGGSLLKYWYSVWDFGNKRMGFGVRR